MNNLGFKRLAAASLMTKRLPSKSLSQCRDSAVKVYNRLQETRKQMKILLRLHQAPQRHSTSSNFAKINDKAEEHNQDFTHN